MPSPHVVELEVQTPYLIWLCFDDGIAGEVDLSDSADRDGIFSAWSDEAFWRSARIVPDTGAVAWGDGTEIDICPLSLYLDLTGQSFDDVPDPDRDFALGWYKRHPSSEAFLASVKEHL